MWNIGVILKLVETIPTTYTKNEIKKTICKTSICNGRYATCDKGFKLTRHLKNNPDCKNST